MIYLSRYHHTPLTLSKYRVVSLTFKNIHQRRCLLFIQLTHKHWFGLTNKYEEYIKRITELNFVSSSKNLMGAHLVLLIFEEIGHLVFRWVLLHLVIEKVFLLCLGLSLLLLFVSVVQYLSKSLVVRSTHSSSAIRITNNRRNSINTNSTKSKFQLINELLYFNS